PRFWVFVLALVILPPARIANSFVVLPDGKLKEYAGAGASNVTVLNGSPVVVSRNFTDVFELVEKSALSLTSGSVEKLGAVPPQFAGSSMFGLLPGFAQLSVV